MSTMFVYVTTGDVEEARRIGRAAVEARLVACANVIAGVDAIYWWHGEVAETEEAVLIMKTMANRLNELVELIGNLHSYECPCIEAWPITDGHRPFLDWIAGEVTGA
ncbi:MAG: divalent-cation tolerance protein CutA [Stellaceae bacterium]